MFASFELTASPHDSASSFRRLTLFDVFVENLFCLVVVTTLDRDSSVLVPSRSRHGHGQCGNWEATGHGHLRRKRYRGKGDRGKGDKGKGDKGKGDKGR